MRKCLKFVDLRALGVMILTAVAIAVLFGCGSKITKDNFDLIKLGMTQQEVQHLLGPPTEATGLELPVFSGTTSKWVHGDTVITIQFVNGRVVAKEFNKEKSSARDVK